MHHLARFVVANARYSSSVLVRGSRYKNPLLSATTEGSGFLFANEVFMKLYDKFKRHHSIESAFHGKYTPVTESGCWLWVSSTHPTLGYAMLRYKSQTLLAHRVSYELHNGSIPDGKVIDHLCRVRCCVNPSHLEAVSQKTNVHRGFSVTKFHGIKTHCAAGHSFDIVNTYIRPDRTGRGCRICRQAALNKKRFVC